MKNEKKGQIKSALELAMERLAQNEGALVELTPDQKEAISEVARITKAKIAEIEILYQPRLAEARAAGDAEKLQKLEAELRAETGRLREKEAQEKERIRKGSA